MFTLFPKVDKDGQLSFSEFAAGALLLYQDALEDELHYLFETCDKDLPVELQVSTALHAHASFAKLPRRWWQKRIPVQDNDGILNTQEATGPGNGVLYCIALLWI